MKNLEVQEIPCCYRTQRFVTVITKICHWII